jgi:predicted PurR-regulated permease PerM
MFGSVGFPEVLVVLAISAILLAIVWPASRICGRIGRSPLLGVLAVVPVANVVLLWFLALAEWPASQSAQGHHADRRR